MDTKYILRQFRLATGLSLEEVAKETGVSKSTLARIETGDSNPTKKTIDKINEGLRTYLEYASMYGLDIPEFVSPEKFSKIIEFNRFILDHIGLQLEIKDSSLEIWNNPNETTRKGYKATITDLDMLMHDTLEMYSQVLNKLFPFEETLSKKTHWREHFRAKEEVQEE